MKLDDLVVKSGLIFFLVESEVEPGNGRESDDDEDDDNGVGMEGGLEDEARGVEAKKTKVAAAAFVPGAKRRWSRRRRAESVGGTEEVCAESGEGGSGGG